MLIIDIYFWQYNRYNTILKALSFLLMTLSIITLAQTWPTDWVDPITSET